MLVELKELAIFFDELDQFFIGTAKRWALSKGITQEDFDEHRQLYD